MYYSTYYFEFYCLCEPRAKYRFVAGVACRPPCRTEVNELMLKLEPMNPTESPARSPVLNGVWEFLYTGGRSPGTLAVQVKKARQRSVLFVTSKLRLLRTVVRKFRVLYDSSKQAKTTLRWL